MGAVVGRVLHRVRSGRWGATLQRTVIVLAASILIGVLAASASGLSAPTPSAAAFNWAPVHSGDFPDPDVLQYTGSDFLDGYYAFATQSTPPAGGHQINIQVSFSSDGVTWNSTGTDALPDSGLAPWAEPGDTWAPSVAVYQPPGNPPPAPVFVMYYTATERVDG